MRSVALDLGARKVAFCEVRSGHVIARRTVGSIHALQDLLGPESEPARVAVEACREAWHVCELLESQGHEVLLVDTTRVRQLGIGHGRKTDRIDAELLALAVEKGSVPVAHRLSPRSQKLRSMLSVRRALVETRSQMIVTIRGLVRAFGERMPSCAAEDFVRHAKRTTLSKPVETLIVPLLAVVERTDAELATVSSHLEHLYESEPMVAVLATAPGVGNVIAAAFISVVDQAERFHNAHQVGAYLGLVPAEHSSGEKRRLGSITKRGNSYLRSLLVQASWNVLRTRDHADSLRAWGNAVARRRGKRVAVIAVARRLAGVLWAMWRDGTAYQPANLPVESAKPNGVRRTHQAHSNSQGVHA